jgi:hypothetical protein
MAFRQATLFLAGLLSKPSSRNRCPRSHSSRHRIGPCLSRYRARSGPRHHGARLKHRCHPRRRWHPRQRPHQHPVVAAASVGHIIAILAKPSAKHVFARPTEEDVCAFVTTNRGIAVAPVDDALATIADHEGVGAQPAVDDVAAASSRELV